MREGIEGGREEEEGEEHQHLSMDLINILNPLTLEVVLLVENPSSMEKMMDGRSCMLELEEAWMEEGLDLQLFATEALKS